jgi:hypothetical protein
MPGEPQIYVIVAAFTMLQCCFKESNGQGLEANLAGVKLSTGLIYSSAVYDGKDFVYVFGG